MILHANAATIASHLVLVAMLALTGWRVIDAQRDGALVQAARKHGMALAVALACLGLGIERLYYVGARFLEPHGFDLWSAHPAPEFLSFLVAVTIYGIGVPFLAARLTPARSLRQVAAELGMMVAGWAGLAVMLSVLS